MIAGARDRPFPPRYSAEEHNMNRLLVAEEEEPQELDEEQVEDVAPSVPEDPVALTSYKSE